MHAILAGNRGDADIGDDEPLRRDIVPIILLGTGDLGGDDVGAGLQVGQHFAHRNGGGGHLVGLALGEIDLPFPDLLAGRVGDVGSGIGRQRLLEDAIAHGRRDRAVADAIDDSIGRLGIDRTDGQAAAQAGRHDVGAVGEADEGLAIRHVDFEFDIVAKAFAVGRRQAGAQLDVIALAVLDAGDAHLAALGFDGDLARGVDDDIAGKIGIGRQRIGEDRTDARRRGLGIHLVGNHAEAVLGHHLVEALFERGIGNQRYAGAVGRNGFAPHFAQFQRMGEVAQSLGALRHGFGPQEAVERGIAGGQSKVVEVAVPLLLRPVGAHERDVGELQPEGGIVAGDAERLAVGHHGTGSIVVGRRIVACCDQIGVNGLFRRRIGGREVVGKGTGAADEIGRRERDVRLPCSG